MSGKPTLIKPRPAGSSPAKPPPKPKKPSSLKFVRAQYGFIASEEGELTFNEGDLICILDDKSDPDWCKARVKGNEGMVPKTYLALDSKLAAPIHDACRRGNLDLLLECLENNIPVNSIDQAGNTALHWACHSGNVECLAKLIERCGNMLTYSLKNRLGDTALHMAAYKGHATVIQILQDEASGKVDFEAENGEGKTAFEIATETETKAVLLKWLMSLPQNPTNIKLQKIRNARLTSGDYDESDDDSDGSDGEK